MILVRLIVAPFILVAYLLGIVVLTTLVGLTWIFTGMASVSATWPDWR